jgi:hypothetical protein
MMSERAMAEREARRRRLAQQLRDAPAIIPAKLLIAATRARRPYTYDIPRPTAHLTQAERRERRLATTQALRGEPA